MERKRAVAVGYATIDYVVELEDRFAAAFREPEDRAACHVLVPRQPLLGECAETVEDDVDVTERVAELERAREGVRIRALAPAVVPSRRRTLPEHDWSVGAAKSLLGSALVALERYDEAEAVLLDARHDRQGTAPSGLPSRR